MLNRRALADTPDTDEYDDLTQPERITNFVMLGLYTMTLGVILWRSHHRQMKTEAKWLKDRNRVILCLIIVSLLSRLIYFADAFYAVFGDKHLVPLVIYMNLNTVTVFCVSQFCLLTCYLWLIFVDRLLDAKLNENLKKVLRVSMYLNFGLFISSLVSIIFDKFTDMLVILMCMSVLVAILVSISGWIFKKSIEKYIKGKLISQVQINVLVICICYSGRFFFDLLKTVDKSIGNLRDYSKDNPDTWYYCIFLVGIIMLVEYLPILMFTMNLTFVYSSNKLVAANKEQPLFMPPTIGSENTRKFSINSQPSGAKNSLLTEYFEG